MEFPLDAQTARETDPLYKRADTNEATAFLESIGVEPSASAKRQLAVFARCMQIFNSRNQRYNDLWSSRGYKGSLFQMDHKMARVWEIFWDSEQVPTQIHDEFDENTDDVFDLINYCVFFLRNAQDENASGRK